MRIFLTGMMGCGKTFWAKKISEAHGIRFVDLDDVIEEYSGKSIRAIFRENGGDHFRETEHACLKAIISQYPEAIIATGGGTPCFYDNLALMKENGKLVYLKTDLNILTKRISQSAGNRPLLQDVAPEHIGMRLSEIFHERKKIYEQSDVIIDMKQIDEATFAEKFLHTYV